jgi:hypothetical protein
MWERAVLSGQPYHFEVLRPDHTFKAGVILLSYLGTGICVEITLPQNEGVEHVMIVG